MNRGRVYSWIPDRDPSGNGRVVQEIVQLERIEAPKEGTARLHGRFVRVVNAGMIYEPNPSGGAPLETRLGDARPDANGDFLFEPGRGGGRIDKLAVADPELRRRYVQASHFGEVNSYYHVDRVGAYVDSLLGELGAPALPPVRVLVAAHHAATVRAGVRDGVRRTGRWVPFQGGHYRLPSSRDTSRIPPPVLPGHAEPPGAFRTYVIVEWDPVHPDGEIHLGPGWKLLRHGALVECAGGAYRANASHNAGILYHEYGHHLTRHTADFCANAGRPPDRQINVKTALDEGTCDYLAAAMMQTPHIWALHRRHDDEYRHARSLSSAVGMSSFDAGPGADQHANGTIWAASLWDLRAHLAGDDPDAARDVDRMVILGLILLGRLRGSEEPPTTATLRRARGDFATALQCLLAADGELYSGRHHDVVLRVFARRGITARQVVNTGS